MKQVRMWRAGYRALGCTLGCTLSRALDALRCRPSGRQAAVWAIAACLFLPAARAQPAGPVDAKAVRELAEGARCGSVVIRHCRLRREVASVVLDPALRGRNGAPMQWEVVQFAGPDSDEIVVSGERLRDPGIRSVFERTFGAPQASDGMLTSNSAGGSRCTTLVGSGARSCSNSGGNLPALDNPLTDWTF